MRRNGLILIVAGILGMLFFWLTDPRWGLAGKWSRGDNPIDAANQALVGTVVGIGFSVFVLIVGLWLMRRKTL
jgi:hypothetical protein